MLPGKLRFIPAPRALVDKLAAHERYVRGQPGGKALKVQQGSFVAMCLDQMPMDQVGLPASDFTKASCRESTFTGAAQSVSNFSWPDLWKACPDHADLRGANFTMANMAGATLRKVDLRPGQIMSVRKTQVTKDVNFSHANLERADFSNTDLSHANLRNVKANGAMFRDSNLYSVNLSGADLTGADLSGSRMKGVILAGARLIRANLANCDLSEANLRNVDLSTCDTTNTNLQDALYRSAGSTLPDDVEATFQAHSQWIVSNGAEGGRASFRDETLIDMDFSGCDLRGVSFQGCNLTGAKFANSELMFANFTDCDLSYADFSGASVSGVTFSQSNLEFAKFIRARLDPADVFDTRLGRVTRSLPVRIKGSNLSGADFADARLQGVELSGSEQSGVRWNLARISACNGITMGLPDRGVRAGCPAAGPGSCPGLSAPGVLPAGAWSAGSRSAPCPPARRTPRTAPMYRRSCRRPPASPR